MPSSSSSSSAASTGASSAGTSAVATSCVGGAASRRASASATASCHCLVTAFDLIFASFPAIISGIDSHAAIDPSGSSQSS